jgi:hypothetical protein
MSLELLRIPITIESDAARVVDKVQKDYVMYVLRHEGGGLAILY